MKEISMECGVFLLLLLFVRGSSFCTSGVLGGRRWGCGEHGCSWCSCLCIRGSARDFCVGRNEFDSCAGSVAVGEDLVGYAADVGFVDGVDLLELVEEL